jgi:predicted nucleic acid-binding protein
VRTAIDTNILSALWSNEPLAERIPQRLNEAKSYGALLIAPIVFVELLAYPRATESFVRHFLSQTGITVDFHLEESVWAEAGRQFARHADRRRKSERGEPKRLPADFLVGAHALLQADRLMTMDAARYRQYFPKLKLL